MTQKSTFDKYIVSSATKRIGLCVCPGGSGVWIYVFLFGFVFFFFIFLERKIDRQRMQVY